MSGFAIWCEGDNINQICSSDYDVHVNLWTNFNTPILDIGIMITYNPSLKTINFFIPFEVSKKYTIIDLGSVITKSKNILDAVFNESYSIISENKSKQTNVQDESGIFKFTVYELDNTKDIEIRKEYNGTIVTINLEEKRGFEIGKKYYFRFRYKDSSLKKLIESRKDYNVFDVLLTENNFVDFRLNDWRSLSNSSLVEHIEDHKIKEYCLSKVNFFVMAQGQIDIISRTKKSERKLENNTWDKYITLEEKSVVIAHQWQVKKENEKYPSSFNAYFKLKRQWMNPKTIASYLVIIILINCLSNFSYKLLVHIFNNTVVHFFLGG